jgi:formylglycine-generating enzyme required for sulfatase activity
MFPFTRDAQWLISRLRRERGAHGLDVRIIDRLPDHAHLARIPAGVPVLALSAMGQFQASAGTMAAWKALAHKLAFLGLPFHALNPCPRQRWDLALVNACSTGVWDRRPRLPRRGGLRAIKGLTSPAVETELLLDLLSPASRIETPLLREARLRLGHHAGAAAEWDAWHHSQCWQSMDCFGLKKDSYEFRLNQRAHADRALAEEVASLIRTHQGHYSRVLTAESDIRACLSGTPDENALRAVHRDLQRVIDRLRLLAKEPGSAQIRRSGLAGWFIDMVDRLSPAIRADALVGELVAQGLALAHTCVETRHTVLPVGVDGEVFKFARAEASLALPAPIVCRIDLIGHHAHAEWHLVPEDVSRASGAFTLATLQVGSRPVQVIFHTLSGRQHSIQFPWRPAPLALPPLQEPVEVTVESDRQRLRFGLIECPAWAESVFYDQKGLAACVNMNGTRSRWRWRTPGMDLPADSVFNPFANSLRAGWEPKTKPEWAHRIWSDDFGIAAGFLIASVPFILRWIPPGRFLMGSPPDEAGRWDAEGPQHEVRISQGFWLGEAPVTQAQWKVVTQGGQAKRSVLERLFGQGRNAQLNMEPSRFLGPELPIEGVDWHDSRRFCELLTALMEAPDLCFHLPTEAQWEYACRAGTQSAFNDGSSCAEPEGKDPALEKLGWFAENSGGQTHKVKQKEPNGWGLYDMHGNVLEWCADGWTEYPATAQTDPRVHGDAVAERVMRGGSWGLHARLCRSACRFRVDPGYVWHDQGLRLAAGQEPEAAEPPGAERPQKKSR